MNDDAVLRGHLRIRLEVLGDEIRGNALAQGLGVDKILRNAVAALENGRLGRAAALMDTVSVFLRGEAEHAAAGAERNRRKRGGEKTAKTRKLEAQQRESKVLAAALMLRAANQRLSNARVAEILNERGHGGTEAIKKLLGRKKSGS